MASALIASGLGLGLGGVLVTAGVAVAKAERSRAESLQRAYADITPAEAAPAAPEPVAAVSSPRRAEAAPAKAKGRELDCLTEAVYFEARGESARGQAAVAQVVLNRVDHPAFPKTVCAVVYQGCQFSFACDGARNGRHEAAAWRRARKVAINALAGAQIAQVGAATHFHTTAVSPNWGPRLAKVGQVGTHLFYRMVPGRPAAPVQEKAVFASFVPPAPAVDAATSAPEPRIAVALLEARPPSPVAAAAPLDAASAAEAPAAALEAAANLPALKP